jgi:peptidoglycan/xylan/chitin deacetylase (PgdA/CDA1 family)
MINVAWGNEYLPEMLDILEQHDAQGTFFIVGRWAERFPDLLQEIHRRGHELANHGYDDGEVMPDLDYNATISSLRRTNEIIEKFTGQQPRYFTPHKGEYSSTTCRAAAALGMRLLVWTLDTVDWKRPGEEAMAQRILDNLSPGAIILMHPTEQSAGFLRLVIPQIKSRGYRVVAVKELLSPDPSFPKLTLQR